MFPECYGIIYSSPYAHEPAMCLVRPSHEGMAHSKVAEGEDKVQPWKAAANVFNKQSQTAEKGWVFIL